MAQVAEDVGEHGAATSSNTFRLIASLLMPYNLKSQDNTEAKMKAMMQKETSLGAISFVPEFQTTPLAQRAKEMSLPDEFRRRLAKRKPR